VNDGETRLAMMKIEVVEIPIKVEERGS